VYVDLLFLLVLLSDLFSQPSLL